MATTIQKCDGCGQLLRIPTDQGSIVVTCPKCRAKWHWPEHREFTPVPQLFEGHLQDRFTTLARGMERQLGNEADFGRRLKIAKTILHDEPKALKAALRDFLKAVAPDVHARLLEAQTQERPQITQLRSREKPPSKEPSSRKRQTEIRAAVELHFHQQREVSVFIESSGFGDDQELFGELALFSALAIRMFSNLGKGECGNNLAALLLNVVNGSQPPMSGKTYGDVALVSYAGSPGRRLFKTAIQLKDGQFLTNVDSVGFGWFDRGYNDYAPIAVLTFLTFLFRKHRDKNNLVFTLAISGLCESVTSLYYAGFIGPFANHHQLAFDALSPYLQLLN